MCSRATSSNTRMNSSPIALRFVSGSVTPESFARNRSAAFTWTSGMWKCRPNVSSTWSGSPSRLRPWSTKTHVSWFPTARCTRSAATAESTPPESAQSTSAPPTWARIRSTESSMMFVGVQSGSRSQPSYRNRFITSWPCGVCETSGWNWTA